MPGRRMNRNLATRDEWVAEEDRAMLAFELNGAAFVMLVLAALVSGEQIPTR
jgi:hypothetical protein